MHALFVHTTGVTSGVGFGVGIILSSLEFELNNIPNAMTTISSATESVAKTVIILFVF